MSKKAQFYIISAVIIIFIILSLTAVSNYASVKQQPEKLLQLSEVLNTEAHYVIENTQYNKRDINYNINAYVTLFSNYIQQTTTQDFSMVILYGDIHTNNVSAFEVTRSSTGGVYYDLGGGQTAGVAGGTQINVIPKEVHVNSVSNENTANITITAGNNTITREVPILADNNFIFVMTTNDEFNQYVRQNFPQA